MLKVLSKKAVALILSVMMVISIVPLVSASAGVGLDSLPEKAEGCNRYYFYMPKGFSNELSDTAAVYWWDEIDVPNTWPGIKANKADAEGVYYYDVPKEVTTIIWTNFVDGGTDKNAAGYRKAFQTTNIPCEYYDPGESELYPEGNNSFDGMIWVCNDDYPWGEYRDRYALLGEWYYYYGNGEYGTTPEKDDAPEVMTDDFMGEWPFEGEPYLPEKPEDCNRYFFYMPEFWYNEYTDTAGIYYWSYSSDTGVEWPGYKANKTNTDGVFYYDVPKDAEMIIWNNFVDGGTDKEAPVYKKVHQTHNIPVEGYEPGESAVYPEGIDSFDGMIFVCNDDYWLDGYENNGEWYYYYGTGLYGASLEKYASSVESYSFMGRADYYLGDADRDDNVTIKDATKIQKCVAKLEGISSLRTILADVDVDGEITVKDASAIQKYIAKIDTGYLIGEIETIYG